MARLRIVLVEPREAGNIGAVARAMKNFGFDDLWIVGEHPPLQPVAGWWASGAEDVIERAHFAPTLHYALAGAQMTVATTSARGRTTPVDLSPFDLAKSSSLGEEGVLALVFGREDRGLTREEVVQCQLTASIPTNPDFPTMNLAQAVCIFCFALYSVSAGTPAGTSRLKPGYEILERLHERAESLLLEVGFLHENNPDRIYEDLRAIAGRADLDAREVTILLGIISQIEWKLGNGG
jgi:tRNA/rRNA methyltransferase